MADYPAFFTVTGPYQSFAANATADVTATVIFTPVVKKGGMVVGFDTAGTAVGFIPTPIVALIDTDGALKLRSEPDLPLRIVDTDEDLPSPGDPDRTYKVEDTGLHYLWDADAEEYVETLGYVPVRLLADDYLHGLDGDLYYDVQFTKMRRKLSGFTFRAPRYDVEVSLIELAMSDGNAMYTRWDRTSSGEMVRVFTVKPGQHAEYTLGWANRLVGDDGIVSASFDLSESVDPDVLQLFSPTRKGHNTQVWVRGCPTVGDRYEGVCSITTVMERTLRQAFMLEVAAPAAETSPAAAEHAYITPSPDRYWLLPANPGDE